MNAKIDGNLQRSNDNTALKDLAKKSELSNYATQAALNDTNANVTEINTYLGGLIRVVDIATNAFSMSAGNRYRGSLTVSVPEGYKIISIIPCYTSYGDRNFMDFNFYYDSNNIYYEIYCQYGWGESGMRSNFRIVMIKNNK